MCVENIVSKCNRYNATAPLGFLALSHLHKLATILFTAYVTSHLIIDSRLPYLFVSGGMSCAPACVEKAARTPCRVISFIYVTFPKRKKREEKKKKRGKTRVKSASQKDVSWLGRHILISSSTSYLTSQVSLNHFFMHSLSEGCFRNTPYEIFRSSGKRRDAQAPLVACFAHFLYLPFVPF